MQNTHLRVTGWKVEVQGWESGAGCTVPLASRLSVLESCQLRLLRRSIYVYASWAESWWFGVCSDFEADVRSATGAAQSYSGLLAFSSSAGTGTVLLPQEFTRCLDPSFLSDFFGPHNLVNDDARRVRRRCYSPRVGDLAADCGLPLRVCFPRRVPDRARDDRRYRPLHRRESAGRRNPESPDPWFWVFLSRGTQGGLCRLYWTWHFPANNSEELQTRGRSGERTVHGNRSGRSCGPRLRHCQKTGERNSRHHRTGAETHRHRRSSPSGSARPCNSLRRGVPRTVLHRVFHARLLGDQSNAGPHLAAR